jgi:DNA-binding NtrC family response regulator
MKDRFADLVDYLLKGNIYLEEAIEVLETSMIKSAMERSEGNQCAAAKQLGIHRNTLQRKLVLYEMGNGRVRRKPATGQGRSRRTKTGAA